MPGGVVLGGVVLGRPGDDLLSQVLRHSTIGAEEFNGRVRDGIGFRLLATATRPAKDKDERRRDCRGQLRSRWPAGLSRQRKPQVCRGPRGAFFGAPGQDRQSVGLPGRDERSCVRPGERTQVRSPGRALAMRAIKPIKRLVPVSCTDRSASTPGLSTWWSTTAFKGELILRWVSRLDAFSGYPVRT